MKIIIIIYIRIHPLYGKEIGIDGPIKLNIMYFKYILVLYNIDKFN